ncbi:alpha beta-hydrolase [Mycena galericulata]|nr:alpha beta-hydrolase [Mycena galericulata]
MTQLSFRESLSLYLTLLQIPLVLIHVYLVGRQSKRANGRPLNRVLNDEIAHFVLSHLSIRQLQAVSGTSLVGYSKWAKQNKIAHVVDELGNGARLMWIGARDTDYVVIYCHGGGFVGPLSDFQVEFWYRVRQAISKIHNGARLGVAILQYSLHPASFPTQLDQLLCAVQHVMDIGVPPSQIFLAGDSAGGNLVLQFLSHILHPSPLAIATPALRSMTGFRGVCLISPWVMPDNVLDSDKENAANDLVPAQCLRAWQAAYLSQVPNSHRAYIQPIDASPQWFDGLDTLVRRVLVTVGGKEILRDSIQRLAEVLKGSHSDSQLDIQDDGVHCDVMFDIGAKSTAPHPVERRIIEWFAECLEG